MGGKKVLAEIKEDLDGYVGQTIRLKANRGRKKVIERTGILEKTYPHIFIIKLDEKDYSTRRMSFSYSDVLTETVELCIIQGDRDVPIVAEKAQ
jgi:uncharacterized protein Veg